MGFINNTCRHVPIPPQLRNSIHNLILSGKNPTTQRWLYNDASLKAMNIVPVLVPGANVLPVALVTPGVPHYANPQPTDNFYTSLRIVPGAASATYTFTNFKVTNTENGSLTLTINIYDDFTNAYEAMVFALSTYECDLTPNTGMVVTPRTVSTIGVVGSNPAFIGNYSLQTPRSVLWVRGNLFIELTILSAAKPSPVANNYIVAAAQRLDTHLARHSVTRSQVRRPQLKFTAAHSPPKDDAMSYSGDTFGVQFDPSDLVLAREMSAIVEQPTLLVNCGFDPATWMHTFWVRDRTGDVASHLDRSTMVKISGAHIDTFHPGSVEFKVNVQKVGVKRQA
jgi:hypothetical protein